jgi:solute carrier family 35 protein C2
MSHPVDSMMFISPAMAVTLLPFALAFEGHHVATSPLVFGGSFQTAMTSLAWVALGSALAFCLMLSEYVLVSHTNRWAACRACLLAV